MEQRDFVVDTSRQTLVKEWLTEAFEAMKAGDLASAWACERRASEFWTSEEHARYLLQKVSYYVIIKGVDIKEFKNTMDMVVKLLAQTHTEHTAF